MSGWASSPMRKIVRLFPLEVWQSREKWMPDGQTCADTRGQMHGAGAAAGRSAHMCRHGKITNSGHPSAAPGDLCPFPFFPPRPPIAQRQPAPAVHASSTNGAEPSGSHTHRLFQRRRNLPGCKEADKATLECTRAELRVSHASPALIAL